MGQAQPAAAGGGFRRHPAFVVSVVTAAQMAVAMTNGILPTIAPEVAKSLGIEAALVGYQVSIFFAAAMAGTLYGGGCIARFGPARAAQFTLGGCIAGSLLFMLPHPAFIVLGSLLAGFTTGFINAAGAQILVSYTPPAHRNLIFSLKQTGMPLGGMVVSLTAPALALAFGWHWAFVPMIAIAAIALSLNQYARPVWDAQRDPGISIKGEALDAIPRVWREPALRWLAIGGFTLSAVQRMLLTYLVLYLVTERGYGLVEAGVLLSVMHAAGFVARPLWGLIADRAQSGMGVLLLIGLVAMLGCFALIRLDASWPAFAVYGVCAALGISSIGWNGLFYAEITRIAGQGNAGAATAGASFFVYAGVLTGQAVFAATFGFVGNYADTLYTMVIISAAAIGALRTAQRRAATRLPVFA